MFLCLVRLLNYIGYGQGNLEENFSKLNHRTFKILEPRDTLVT